MKIALVCPRSPRLFYGGLENMSQRIAEYLVEKGEQVELYCVGPTRETIEKNGVIYQEFPGISPSESYYFSWPLYKELKKSDADIIHVMAYNNILSYLSLRAKKPNQKYILSTNVGGEPPAFRKILHIPYQLVFRRNVKEIDKVITISELQKKEFEEKLGIPSDKFVIIPPGIDFEKVLAVKAGEKKNYIIGPGRFAKIKNFHHLIPAFARIAKEFPHVNLLLIGSGPLEEQLHQQVSKLGLSGRVIFEKPVPLSEMHIVHKKIKESLACVLLTDSGFEGIMGFEAIACGVPVVFADSSGTTDSVKKGYAFAVKNPEDHEKVSDLLRKILKNPSQYTPVNPILPYWKDVLAEHYSVYKSVLKRNT